MSGAVKSIGKGLGSVAKFAAPIVSKIPGVGTFAAPLLAAGGSILSGGNMQSHLQAGLGALNPFSIPGLGGMLGGIGGGQQGMMGQILRGMGVGTNLNPSAQWNPMQAGQAFMGGMGFNNPMSGMGMPWQQQGGMGGQPWGQGGGFQMPTFAPAGQPQQGGGSPLDAIFGFLKDPKNLALLGLGAGGIGLANKGGLFDPKVVADPRNQAAGSFAQMFQNQLKSQGGTLGEGLAGMGTIPGYEGQFFAGPTAGQQGDLDIVQQALQRFMGGDQGAGALGQIGQMAGSGGQLNLPPEIAALFGGGQDVLSGLGQGSDPISQLLMQLGGDSPERQMLLQAGGQDPTGGGQDIIRQASQLLMNLPEGDIGDLLRGGQGTDINQIASMLDQARQPGLNRDLRNMQEQYSFSGLRNSTDAETAAQRLMGESQAALTGQLASIMPQLAATRSQTSLGALGALGQIGGQLGNLGQMAGNLGLGQQQNVLGAFGQAGQLGQGGQGQTLQALQSILQSKLGAGTALQQGGTQQADILSRLFGGQQGNALQAALAQPGALSQMAQLPGVLGQQAFSMEDIIRQAQQQGVQNQMSAFNQSQSLLPNFMQFLSSTPQQQVGDSLFSQLGGLLLGGAGLKASK